MAYHNYSNAQNKQRAKVATMFKQSLDGGQTLISYKKALQDALGTEQPDTTSFAVSICESDIPIEVKAALLRAMHKLKLPLNNKHQYSQTKIPMEIALEKQDLKLIRVLHDLNIDFPNTRGYYNRSIGEAVTQLGHNNAEVAINLITKYKLKSDFIMCILKGALSQPPNMPVVKYLIEIEKINLYAPTRSSSSIYNMTGMIYENLELIKYLHKHGYNIHCCRRSLLKQVVRKTTPEAKRIQEYILEDQLKTQPAYAALYMERITQTAYQNNNIELVEKFPYMKGMAYADDLIAAFRKSNITMIKSMCMKYVRYKCRWSMYDTVISEWRLAPLSRKVLRMICDTVPRPGPVRDYAKEFIIKFSREYDGKWAMKYKFGETVEQLETFPHRRTSIRAQMHQEFLAEEKWLAKMKTASTWENKVVDVAEEVTDLASRIFAEADKKQRSDERTMLSAYYEGPPSDDESWDDGPELPDSETPVDNI